MRITGEIEVCNRLLPSHNISNKRPEWSNLSVGYYKSQKDSVYILHQTLKNGIGVKYKVNGNLLGVFTRYISQGKMTIRFKNPCHDLIIRSTEEQLVKFCGVVQELIIGKVSGKSKRLTDLSALPAKVIPKPKTKLQVKSKNDMPITDPYPRTLEILQVNNAGLSKLDGRIFRLQKLKVLNLENNCLEVLPEQLSLLPCLKELYLAGNMLGNTPLNNWLLLDNLQSGLIYLDLRQNGLHSLPCDIYKLRKLKTLLLDDNLLHKLPNSFGRLSELRELRISNNKLIVLPASFRFLFLDVLDISCNPGWLTNYSIGQNLLTVDESPTLSLLDLSAKAVVNYRLDYDKRTLPLILVHYLDKACYCVCGQATFPSKPEGYIKFDIGKICLQVTFTEFNLPIEVRYCANRCRTMYR